MTTRSTNEVTVSFFSFDGVVACDCVAPFTEVKDVNNCSILNASGSKVDSM